MFSRYSKGGAPHSRRHRTAQTSTSMNTRDKSRSSRRNTKNRTRSSSNTRNKTQGSIRNTREKTQGSIRNTRDKTQGSIRNTREKSQGSSINTRENLQNGSKKKRPLKNNNSKASAAIPDGGGKLTNAIARLRQLLMSRGLSAAATASTATLVFLAFSYLTKPVAAVNSDTANYEPTTENTYNMFEELHDEATVDTKRTKRNNSEIYHLAIAISTLIPAGAVFYKWRKNKAAEKAAVAKAEAAKAAAEKAAAEKAAAEKAAEEKAAAEKAAAEKAAAEKAAEQKAAEEKAAEEKHNKICNIFIKYLTIIANGTTNITQTLTTFRNDIYKINTNSDLLIDFDIMKEELNTMHKIRLSHLCKIYIPDIFFYIPDINSYCDSIKPEEKESYENIIRNIKKTNTGLLINNHEDLMEKIENIGQYTGVDKIIIDTGIDRRVEILLKCLYIFNKSINTDIYIFHRQILLDALKRVLGSYLSYNTGFFQKLWSHFNYMHLGTLQDTQDCSYDVICTLANMITNIETMTYTEYTNHAQTLVDDNETDIRQYFGFKEVTYLIAAYDNGITKEYNITQLFSDIYKIFHSATHEFEEKWESLNRILTFYENQINNKNIKFDTFYTNIYKSIIGLCTIV